MASSNNDNISFMSVDSIDNTGKEWLESMFYRSSQKNGKCLLSYWLFLLIFFA